MRYLIAWVSGILFMIFMTAIGWCAYFTFTDNVYWLFVAIGLLLPAFMLLNITAIAYTSAKSYNTK